jgi:hypothetical protein
MFKIKNNKLKIETCTQYKGIIWIIIMR